MHISLCMYYGPATYKLPDKTKVPTEDKINNSFVPIILNAMKHTGGRHPNNVESELKLRSMLLYLEY